MGYSKKRYGSHGGRGGGDRGGRGGGGGGGGGFHGGGGGRGRSFGGGGGFHGGGGGRSFSGPKEMHKAVCSDCGKECEVPFQPTEGRPVYCRDCFQKHKTF
ncbi:MAG: CxxC-x17-CxxC domain-containing protein [Candidatus Micrarchaeota archaeon]